MHTFELQRNIALFFSDSERFQPFIEALANLAASTETMESYLPGIAVGGGPLTQFASQIHSHLANTRQTTSQINQRLFFKALDHFQHAITLLQPTATSQSNLITNLDAAVDDFASTYDGFISNQTGENAVPLLIKAKVLQARIETFFATLLLVAEFVDEYEVPGSEEAALALLLPSHLSVGEFAHRLLAVQSLYTELCMLLSVPESSHPLRISKIESGSLWAKLFGESKVIGMMVSLLEQGAAWIFRTYTTEGKIAAVPKKVEALKTVLGLAEQLEALGFNTSEMNDHVQKSAVAIAKDLTEILDGQSSITINDKKISVGTEISKSLLEGTPRLRLPPVTSIINKDDPALPPKLE